MSVDNSPQEGQREEDYLSTEPKLELLYQTLKNAYGIDHDNVVDIGLQLAGAYIGNYKLNHCDQLLKELQAAYEKRGGLVQIRGRESLAFCRWKQGKYDEALEIFEWQLKVVGPNVALYENMGHTYNKIGNYDQAERCLKGALELLDQGVIVKPGQKGGIYLGLANVQQSKSNIQGALESRLKALETYTKSYGSHPHSLCAKANMYVGQTYMQLISEFRKAEPYFREALHLFQITCAASPLTLSSLCELGDFLVCVNTPESVTEAHAIFKQSLEMQKDLETVHVWEVNHAVKQLMDHPVPGSREPDAEITPAMVLGMYAYIKEYFPLINSILELIQKQNLPIDIKLLDLYLTVCNAYFLSGESKMCEDVIMQTVKVASKLDKDNPKVKEAISHCSSILQYLYKNK